MTFVFSHAYLTLCLVQTTKLSNSCSLPSSLLLNLLVFFQIVLLFYLSQLGATWPRFKPTLIAIWFRFKPNVGLGLIQVSHGQT
jgi:hypothetical protein